MFFQKYWHIVGSDVCQAVQHSFANGFMHRNMNHTLISLIPKVKQVQKMRDLRPIALCNVIYKIISKVLASRLQPIMDSIIKED